MVNTMIKTIWGEKSLFRVGTWRQEKAVGEALGPMARSVQLVFLDNPGPPYPLPISARWHHPLICWALPYQSLIKKLPPRLPTSQSDGCIFSIFVPSSKWPWLCQVDKTKPSKQEKPFSSPTTGLLHNTWDQESKNQHEFWRNKTIFQR